MGISLPMTTPKEMPTATCHRGIVGGRVRGKSMPVTRKPSFTSWRRIVENRASQKPPTALHTRKTGRNQRAPWTTLATRLPGSMPTPRTVRTTPRQPSAVVRPNSARARFAWYPVFHMAMKMHGTMARTTVIIMRFRSRPSRTWAALRVTSDGVYRNVSTNS